MRKRMVQAILGAAALVVGLLGTTAVANAGTGDTVSVACGDVSGLITQINEANSDGGLTTILLAPYCDYVLTSAYTGTSGLPDVTADIKLVGRITTIERGTGEVPNFRIEEVSDGGTLTTQGIRFSNGSRYVGGCFLVEDGGTLTIQRGEVDHCSAVFGGGIDNRGDLTVTGVNISYNFADEAGGGIFNDEGFMQLQGSTMTRNTAFGGGAIDNTGEAILSNSHVYLNLAEFGAGVSEDGDMTLVMTWVAGNQPDNCYPAGSVVGCYG